MASGGPTPLFGLWLLVLRQPSLRCCVLFAYMVRHRSQLTLPILRSTNSTHGAIILNLLGMSHQFMQDLLLLVTALSHLFDCLISHLFAFG